MATYEELIRRKYNNDICVDAFRKLIEHPKDPDAISLAIETALPVLGCVLNSNFKRVQPGTEEYEEILSSVPFSLYMYLCSDRFYSRFYNSSDSHFSFLFGIFRFEVLNTLKKTRRFSLDHISSDSEYSSFGLESMSGFTEFKVLFNELPDDFFGKVESKVRFSGDEREIVLLIIRNFKEQRCPPVSVISQWWKLGKKQIEFLINYVCTIIRFTLFEMKTEMLGLPNIINSEKDFHDRNLQDVFANGMHSSRQH